LIKAGSIDQPDLNDHLGVPAVTFRAIRVRSASARTQRDGRRNALITEIVVELGRRQVVGFAVRRYANTRADGR
jgi:hypothetical protein